MPSQGTAPVISIPLYMIPVLFALIPICWIRDRYMIWKLYRR